MLTLHTKLSAADHAAANIAAQLVLPYELREKCRLRATLDTGEDKRVVKVVAAPEPTYKVTCADAHTLLRCAFHLGNRHTQAQVGDGFLRIRADAVLKEMLAGLGAKVEEEQAAFEPESGAYGGGHAHHDDGGHHPLAPIPLRQKIHRPSDPK